MWCRKCLREFQVNGGARASAVCPLCGQMLEETTRQSQAIRQAREILERWQASSLFDRIQETESAAPLKQQAEAAFPGLPGTRAPVRATPAALPHRPVAEVTPAAAPVLENPVQVKSPEETRPARPAVDRPAATVAAHRSLVRELPPLPTDLLAPPPLLAAAARADSQARRAIRPAITAPSPASSNAPLPASSLVPAVARALPQPAAVAVYDERPATDESVETVAIVQPDIESDCAETEAAPSAEAAVDDVAAYFETAGSELMDVAGSACEIRHGEVAEEPQSPPAILPAETRVVEVTPPFTASVADEPDMSGEHPAETQHFVLPMATAGTSESPSAENSSARPRPLQRRPPLSRKPQVSRPATPPTPGDPVMSQSQPADARIAPAGAGASATAQSNPAAGTKLRFDSGVAMQQLAAADHGRVRAEFPAAVRALDQIYAGTPRPMSVEQQNTRRTNVTSLIGQTLSYLGVLGLTIGTSMVILGHFGGYADYTPTGWLVTTVAQMLLFLGVINLVSGGIEQNNEDVSRRISALGEQLLRIEQSTSTLRGPHLPAAVWQDDESLPGESSSADAVPPLQRRTSAV